jgi:hypothetical protein
MMRYSTYPPPSSRIGIPDHSRMTGICALQPCTLVVKATPIGWHGFRKPPGGDPHEDAEGGSHGTQPRSLCAGCIVVGFAAEAINSIPAAGCWLGAAFTADKRTPAMGAGVRPRSIRAVNA